MYMTVLNIAQGKTKSVVAVKKSKDPLDEAQKENRILKAKIDLLLQQNKLLKEQNLAFENLLKDATFLDAEVRNILIDQSSLLLLYSTSTMRRG